MARLRLEPGIDQPDALYDRLVALHAGLDERRSLVALSKLVLLLANHIADREVIEEAIAIAREPSV